MWSFSMYVIFPNLLSCQNTPLLLFWHHVFLAIQKSLLISIAIPFIMVLNLLYTPQSHNFNLCSCFYFFSHSFFSPHTYFPIQLFITQENFQMVFEILQRVTVNDTVTRHSESVGGVPHTLISPCHISYFQVRNCFKAKVLKEVCWMLWGQNIIFYRTQINNLVTIMICFVYQNLSSKQFTMQHHFICLYLMSFHKNSCKVMGRIN